MSNSLIKVFDSMIDNILVKTVNARELHLFLESKFGKTNRFNPRSSPKNNGPLIRQPWYFANQSSPTASTISFEEIGLRRALSQFASYLIENSRDIEPEYVKIVEENFWDLLA